MSDKKLEEATEEELQNVEGGTRTKTISGWDVSKVKDSTSTDSEIGTWDVSRVSSPPRDGD